MNRASYLAVGLVLAKSGIVIDGPHLRIAPAAHPVIDVDARLLDAVREQELRVSPRVAVAASVVGGASVIAAGLLGGAVIWLPVVFGAFALNRITVFANERRARCLRLDLGEISVVLSVADGPAAVAAAVAHLAPWTRSAPITDASVYEDARRRLASAAAGGPAAGADGAGTLSVGEAPVRVAGDTLWVGPQPFSIDYVRDMAALGANLHLGPGIQLQAAVALLVVAADARARAGEDPRFLVERIRAYEAWTGRTAVR